MNDLGQLLTLGLGGDIAHVVLVGLSPSVSPAITNVPGCVTITIGQAQWVIAETGQVQWVTAMDELIQTVTAMDGTGCP